MMQNYQDTETGQIWAFEDDFDPLSANNRNIPTTLSKHVLTKPDDSCYWYNGAWVAPEELPVDYTPPVSNVPAFNPAWMLRLKPYTAVCHDELSMLNITLEQVNNNSYDAAALSKVVATLPVHGLGGLPALISYDGIIAIPQCEAVPTRSHGVDKLNEVLCCLLLGGVHVEVLRAEDLVVGMLHNKNSLFAFTPSIHTSLRCGWAGISERIEPLMHPRVLLIEELLSSYNLGHQALRALQNFTPLFMLAGYTGLIYRNNGDALNNIWISVEQLTEFLWRNNYKKNTHTFPERVLRCHAKVKRSIDNKQIKAKLRQLRLAKIISRDCHRVLEDNRIKRNALAHKGIVPESEAIEKLWRVIPDLIETASGVSLLSMRTPHPVLTADWDIPARTNFNEWHVLANS